LRRGADQRAQGGIAAAAVLDEIELDGVDLLKQGLLDLPGVAVSVGSQVKLGLATGGGRTGDLRLVEVSKREMPAAGFCYLSPDRLRRRRDAAPSGIQTAPFCDVTGRTPPIRRDTISFGPHAKPEIRADGLSTH